MMWKEIKFNDKLKSYRKPIDKFIVIQKKKKRVSGLCCTLGAAWITIIYHTSVKFETNDSYNCIRKTILNEDDLSA